ncbi:MAG: sulfatase-like hydrolase/transferase [Hyphomicrobiaceae bacterium]
MPTKPANLLIIMADEHTQRILGCYGDQHVYTPNLDRLAARGTRFTDAYTPCPICVPARASFATGRYVHEIGHWDNGHPYSGEPRAWGNVLQRNGHLVDSIGKLHYRAEDDPVGFDHQHVPLHVVDGVGDLLGAVKDPQPPRERVRDMAMNIGPGETGYTHYDRQIRDVAADWLKARADQPHDGKPWTCFVSMVCPHFPLIAPEKFYQLYADTGLMPTKPIPELEHPWHVAYRDCFLYDTFTPERTKIALASYYGLVSFVDDNIGHILDTLDATGLAATTRVLYVSDHGDNVGERGVWGKSNFYEESVAIPAMIAGPGIPKGHVCHTPISLTDAYPTVLDSMGLDDDDCRPGTSIIEIASANDDPARVIFSEYHAAGAATGAFMIRKGRYKFIHYTGYPPQLFDLVEDPHELDDLGGSPAHADTREALENELHKICDPDAVHAAARASQAALVEKHGGRDAVIARGSFGGTPAPGEKPVFK